MFRNLTFSRLTIATSTAAVLSLAAAPASATVYTSKDGWLEVGDAWSASYSHSEAGYNNAVGFSASVRATTMDYPIAFPQFNEPGAGSTLSGSLDVPVTVFSHNHDLFSVSVRADAYWGVNNDSSATGSYTLSADGAVIDSNSFGLPASATLVNHCITFFKDSGDFDVKGVAFYVDSAAIGCAGLDASASADLNGRQLSATFTPHGNVDLEYGCGVGKGVTLGIEGHMTLANVSVPLTTSTGLVRAHTLYLSHMSPIKFPASVRASESGSITADGLDGGIDVVAKVLGFKVWSQPILHTSGIKYGNTPIFSDSQITND